MMILKQNLDNSVTPILKTPQPVLAYKYKNKWEENHIPLYLDSNV